MRAIIGAKRVAFVIGLVSLGGWSCHWTENSTAGASASAPAAAAAPLVSWKAGDAYTYRVELSSTSRADSAPSAVAFTLTGALAVRPQFEGAVTEFYAELRDVTVRAVGDGGGSVPPELQADLSSQWGFELADGSFRSIRARAATSAFAVGILNTLAAAFQSPSGAAADGGVWEHAEADASGTYRARYTAGAEAGELVRVKTGYDARALPGGKLPFGPLNAAPTVVASQGQIRFQASDLFVVRTHDELEADFTLGSKVHSTTDLSLALVDHGANAPPPDWAALRASTTVMQPGRLLASRPAADPYDLKLAADVTFPQALAVAEKESTPAPGSSANPLSSSAPDEGTARDRLQSFGTLVALLRTRSGTVPLATAAIDRGSPARFLLLDALGTAGTPEALSAVVVRARRADLPVEIRRKAAFALIRTARPSDASVDALIGLLGDPVLHSYAVLGLGTYSRRLRESGNIVLANRAMDAVFPLLDSARNRLDRIEVLQGIANAGDGRAFARVKPLVDDADDALRAAAVDAIRLMPNPEVDAMVARHMSPGEKIVVRLEAIDAARLRGPHEPLIAAVRTAATGASDSESRLKSVRLLEKWMGERPEVRATLEQVAREDARDAVRQAAKAALGT